MIENSTPKRPERDLLHPSAAALESHARIIEDWQKDVDELEEELDMIRRLGHYIIFTNGCFDLLHAGHVIGLATLAAISNKVTRYF